MHSSHFDAQRVHNGRKTGSEPQDGSICQIPKKFHPFQKPFEHEATEAFQLAQACGAAKAGMLVPLARLTY